MKGVFVPDLDSGSSTTGNSECQLGSDFDFDPGEWYRFLPKFSCKMKFF